MKDIKKLEDKIQVKFKNPDLLTQAMVHRSYLNENPNFKMDHNERLEFLGDAILELVVTEYLYKKYPNPEGELTNWRASLVNSSSLAEIAEKLSLDKFLYLSRGETKDTGKGRQYIMANCVEAIIGAIYLDQGMRKAALFIKTNVISRLDYILKNKLYIDPKSNFQEKAQEITGITPNYKVLEASGPDHNKKFIVGAYLENELVASGEGGSKQEAQTTAAKKALQIKGWLNK